MGKSIISLSKALVKNEDRTSDGNLLPETRERLLKSIKKHLQNTGRLNVSEVASMVGLSRQTAKKLVDEILMEWQEDTEDQVLIQTKWFESVLKDIDRHPETFGKEKVEIVKLKSMLLGKLNALHKILLKEKSPKINLYLVKQETMKGPPKNKPS